MTYDHTKDNIWEAVGMKEEEFEPYKDVGKKLLQDIIQYDTTSEATEVMMNFLLNPIPEKVKALILYTNVSYISLHGILGSETIKIEESVYGFDHKADKVSKALGMDRTEVEKAIQLGKKVSKIFTREVPSKIIESVEKEVLLNDTYELKFKAIVLSGVLLAAEGYIRELDDRIEHEDDVENSNKSDF